MHVIPLSKWWDDSFFGSSRAHPETTPTTQHRYKVERPLKNSWRTTQTPKPTILKRNDSPCIWHGICKTYVNHKATSDTKSISHYWGFFIASSEKAWRGAVFKCGTKMPGWSWITRPGDSGAISSIWGLGGFLVIMMVFFDLPNFKNKHFAFLIALLASGGHKALLCLRPRWDAGGGLRGHGDVLGSQRTDEADASWELPGTLPGALPQLGFREQQHRLGPGGWLLGAKVWRKTFERSVAFRDQGTLHILEFPKSIA